MAYSTPPPAHLDREYLPVRAKILEIASALDRIQRAFADDTDDPRWEQLQSGVKLLLAEDADRAEQVQLLFSRPYDELWRQNFGV